MTDPAGGVCEEEAERGRAESPRRRWRAGVRASAARSPKPGHGSLGSASFSPSLRGAPSKGVTSLTDTVTDRLPWLSYHSADAVHSKGTVL